MLWLFKLQHTWSICDIFFIWSDLFNCLRKIWKIRTENDSNKSFPVLMYCTAIPEISSSSKNIKYKTRVFRLFFRFLWQYFEGLWVFLWVFRQSKKPVGHFALRESLLIFQRRKDQTNTVCKKWVYFPICSLLCQSVNLLWN